MKAMIHPGKDNIGITLVAESESEAFQLGILSEEPFVKERVIGNEEEQSKVYLMIPSLKNKIKTEGKADVRKVKN